MANRTIQRARFRIKENFEYTLRDSNGNIKQLFSDGVINSFIIRVIRKFVKNPIDATGKVKEGLINQIAAYGLRINGITGKWVDRMLISNLITTTGKAGAASRINGSGGEAAFTYIAVGIGTTAANVADTTLESEIVDSGLARVNATVSLVTTDTANDTAQAATTFSVSGTKAVTEAGLLNAAAAGTLLNRQVFSAINVVSGDSLTVTIKIDVD